MSCGRVEPADQISPSDTANKPCACVKCQSPDILKSLQNSSYCSDCFLSQTRLKFWRQLALIKNLQSTPQDNKALIAVNASVNSVAMLRLMKGAQSTLNGKKKRVPPLQHFHSVQIISDSSTALPQELLSDFPLQQVELCQMLSQSTPSQSLDLNNLQVEPNHSSEEESPSEKLDRLLRPLSATSEATLVSSLTFRLLVKTAKEEGCSVILLDDGMDQIAMKTLSNIALGQGASLGEAVSSCYLHQGLVILRPLAGFHDDELLAYCQVNALDTDLLITRFNNEKNIQNLVKSFVTNLQSNFPATVSTISRTAEKLGQRSTEAAFATCSLCHQPRIKDAQSWKTKNSITQFDSDRDIRIDPLKTDLSADLCYGCIVALQESKSLIAGTSYNVSLPL